MISSQVDQFSRVRGKPSIRKVEQVPSLLTFSIARDNKLTVIEEGTIFPSFIIPCWSTNGKIPRRIVLCTTYYRKYYNKETQVSPVKLEMIYRRTTLLTAISSPSVPLSRTSALNRSPADRCAYPYLLDNLLHCVPLPAPGAPNTNTTFGTAIIAYL